ncbi:hypothetical protein HUJ04_011286 [Dendroctonus ponderosae]|nr:hypothetical protein HUJ04_011286 [Dendroctonus ponderosae]
MASLLTRGALGTIMQGEDITGPVVQVLSVKKINTGSGNPDKDRYRVFLSDGQYTVSAAMMTAPVYAKAGEKGLTKFTIMKIERFITSVINNPDGRDSRVLLILDLLVLKDGDEVNEKFGSPVPYTPDAKSIPRPNGSSASARKRLFLLRWVIKARVINKGEIRKWENAKGSGQLFNFDLADESGEIRCTAFRDLVDKYYDMIQVDKVYYISGCQLKPANKQFNSLKNEYEMAMSNETVIEECLDDDLSKVQTQYDFVEINVLGVAKSTGELEKFQARSGRELQKKEIQLVDRSNSSVTLTLWGAQAENFDGSGNPVIALKGARISEFGGGKTLSTISGTLLKINPEITECYQLKGWFESDGMNANANDISARGGLGVSFTPPWMSFKQVYVLGVAKSTGELEKFQARSGRELQKKEIQLVDRSNSSVTLTLWGAQAENFDGSGNPVIALKGARISEFGGGKTLSTISGTLLKINPEITECYQLKGWFESDGMNANANDISARGGLGVSFTPPWMSFKQVVDQQLGSSLDKGDYYQVKGTILLLRRENCLYKACPKDGCNKKVVDNDNGTYTCEKCGKSYENFRFRLLCNWISMFNDECEKVLGLSSQAAGELMEANNDAFTDVIEQAQFQEFILKCRVKMETYNDEHCLKTVAVRVEPVNYAQYNANLIQSIKKLAGLSR